MNTQKKTLKAIVDSGNHYARSRSKEINLLYIPQFKKNLLSRETDYQVNQGHGPMEKRRVSLCKLEFRLIGDRQLKKENLVRDA